MAVKKSIIMDVIGGERVGSESCRDYVTDAGDPCNHGRTELVIVDLVNTPLLNHKVMIA